MRKQACGYQPGGLLGSTQLRLACLQDAARAVVSQRAWSIAAVGRACAEKQVGGEGAPGRPQLRPKQTCPRYAVLRRCRTLAGVPPRTTASVLGSRDLAR